MTYSIAGIPALDNHLTSLRSDEVLQWLRRGFAVLDSIDLDERRRAFLPLELHPDRDLLGQLGTALREAEQEKLRATERLRSIVTDHLAHPTVVVDEPPEPLRRFWQLLAAIGCPAAIFALARQFLEELLAARPPALFEHHMPRPALRLLIEAIVSTVASAKPISQGQLSFFDFIRTKGEFWHPGFIDIIVDCQFARAKHLHTDEELAVRRLSAWARLREALDPELSQRCAPGMPAGRAMLRSIARYLAQPHNAATTVQEATELQHFLWSLDGVNQAREVFVRPTDPTALWADAEEPCI